MVRFKGIAFNETDDVTNQPPIPRNIFLYHAWTFTWNITIYILVPRFRFRIVFKVSELNAKPILPGLRS